MDQEPSTTVTELVIELGDIIQVEAPTNSDIHKKIFFVNYIDSTQIQAFDNKDLKKQVFNILDGKLTDESILSISILFKHPEKGYARQNGLLKDKWITIEFGGDVPVLMTGQITNLEEDMIEVKTYPEGETIYMDFAYKGLPLDIPIQTIKIRQEPVMLKELATEESTITPEATVTEEAEGAEPDEDIIIDENLIGISTKDVKSKLRQVIMDADDIVFGEDLGEVDEVVDVGEKQRRYGIETQMNDLMDEMLSTIPNAERTRTVLNRIHKLIERFKQLRGQFSQFDEGGNANRIPKRWADTNKPAIDVLMRLSRNLTWILPIVTNNKKVYDLIDNEESSNIVNKNQFNELNDELQVNETDYDKKTTQLSKYRTPFDAVAEDETQVLGNVNVETDIDVVVASLENFASTVVKNNIAKTRRFVINRYNLGEKRLKSSLIRGSKMRAEEYAITKNDLAQVTGFVVLPQQYVRFSGIKLPATNIYNKANMSQASLRYWQVLNEMIDPVVISYNTIDEKRDLDNYFRSVFIHKTSGTSISQMKNKYEEFLNKVIPRTSFLLELLSSYISDKLSYDEVVAYLEPFMIYDDAVTYNNYEEIAAFVHTNIVEFRKNYEKNKTEFLKMRKSLTEENTQTFLKDPYDSNNRIYDSSVPVLFNDDSVGTFYDPIFRNLAPMRDPTGQNPVLYNSSEILTKTSEFDYGRALHLGMAYNGSQNLVGFDVDLESRIKSQMTKETSSNDEVKNDDSCQSYVLAKKYVDLQELEEDNGINEIYFDKQYDETRYDIILEYKQERDTMPREEFIDFLEKKLVEAVGLSERAAKREANAIYDGKRKVEDGDWAVLEVENGSELMYYERRSGKWEYDPNGYKENHHLATMKQGEFCQLNPIDNCYKDGPDCKSSDVLNAKLNKKLMDEMAREVQMEYQQNIVDFKKNIESEMKDYYYYGNKYSESDTGRFTKLYDIYYYNKIKTNLVKAYIGETLEERNVVVSPWQKLFHIILGQSDFIKKQQDIIRFANSYTKEDKTNPYMLVCKDTGVPLVPTFMIELANSATGMSSIAYDKVLDRICKEERATISDSGDAFVDKYSGYVIKNIEFSNEEGYEDSGYKYVSREVLEQDLGEALTTMAPSAVVYTDIKSRMISNVFNAMTNQMNVILDNERDFVVLNALDAINKKLPSVADHKAMEDKMKAKGKRYPSYDEYTNAIVMYYTLAFTLIAVQCAIPSVKTKKTFPGCIKSFKGFPVYDELDMSALTYIACVANAIKSSSDPWSAIKGKGTNVETLTKQIRTALDDIIKNVVIRQKIQTKRDYLVAKPDDLDDIPSELRVNRWTTFLPSLNRVELEASSKKAIAPEFKSSLVDAVSTGDASQVEKMNTLMSKIFYYSLAIQEAIQGSVDKEELLLKTNNGMPFMENVCCNDGSVDTFKYFNDKTDGEIEKYNKMVKDIKKIYVDYMTIIKPVYYLSKEDTKTKYPSVNQEFNEDTIYSAFIHFCKFNKNIPLTDEVMAICLSNKSTFNVSDSLKTKIETLKKEGRTFTLANLHSLLSIINNNNLVKVNLNIEALSQKEKLSVLLTEEETSSSTLARLLRGLIDNFDGIILKEKDETLTDELYNFLHEQVKDMKTRITQFIKRFASTTYNKMRVDKFLSEITGWKATTNPITMTTEDETNVRIVDKIKNHMSQVCCELPMLVMNKVSYSSMRVPSHWGLSDKHNAEITTMINELTDKLKVNYVDAGDYDEAEVDTDDNIANKLFGEVLRTIREKTKQIYVLMKNTPIYASLNATKKHIVGSELIAKLHEYYLLSTFIEYISVAEERKNTLLSEKISKLLVTYIDILSMSKNVVNMNKEDIMAQVLRSKEIEKKEITDYLGALSTEKRKVEDLFKASKLGDKWSMGLTEAVYKYDPDVYDKEMEAAAKRVAADSRADGEGVADILGEDVMEEYDMSKMANDDEYAEGMDGDEVY
jgi:hypothetical protein